MYSFLTTAVAVSTPSEAQLRIKDRITKPMILVENSTWEWGWQIKRYRENHINHRIRWFSFPLCHWSSATCFTLLIWLNLSSFSASVLGFVLLVPGDRGSAHMVHCKWYKYKWTHNSLHSYLDIHRYIYIISFSKKMIERKKKTK